MQRCTEKQAAADRNLLLADLAGDGPCLRAFADRSTCKGCAQRLIFDPNRGRDRTHRQTGDADVGMSAVMVLVIDRPCRRTHNTGSWLVQAKQPVSTIILVRKGSECSTSSANCKIAQHSQSTRSGGRPTGTVQSQTNVAELRA